MVILLGNREAHSITVKSTKDYMNRKFVQHLVRSAYGHPPWVLHTYFGTIRPLFKFLTFFQVLINVSYGLIIVAAIIKVIKRISDPQTDDAPFEGTNNMFPLIANYCLRNSPRYIFLDWSDI